MIPQVAIETIRGRLAARSSGSQLNNYILNELNAAQEELELGPTMAFFLEKQSPQILPSIVFTGFDAPGDFIIEHEDRPVYWTSDSGGVTILGKKFYDELFKKYGVSGDPLYYSLIAGSQFFTFPTTATGTYALRYYAKQPLITSLNLNTETAWYKYAPFLLIAKAGLSISAHYIKDAELATMFANDLAIAQKQFLALCTMHEINKMELADEELRG